ncbi:MAG TPA: Nif11-like leader peptide family natural product precursor [Herpetosiphonaceae bacterium]
MSQASLEQFRQRVLADPALQAQLRETPDKPAFIARMLQLGAELGYEFNADEIEAALAVARRAWTQRGSTR